MQPAALVGTLDMSCPTRRPNQIPKQFGRWWPARALTHCCAPMLRCSMSAPHKVCCSSVSRWMSAGQHMLDLGPLAWPLMAADGAGLECAARFKRILEIPSRMPLKHRSSSLSCSRWLLRPRSGPWSTLARLCQGGGSPNFAGGLGTSAGGLAGTSRAS